MAEYWTGTGQHLEVHEAFKCWGDNCVIHNPSKHPLSHRPTHWRDDIGIMERICEHGVGHPDPDGLLKEDEGIHGCCGCCQ